MSNTTVTNKIQNLITFLRTCPYLSGDALSFNFGDIEDSGHIFITEADSTYSQIRYIDGSILKSLTFNIDTFKTIAYNDIVPNKSDENVDDFEEVQNLLDWIVAQNKIKNYPDFGQYCKIDEMNSLTATPQMITADSSDMPPVAVYRITVQIIYLDTTDSIYNMNK